MDPESPNRTVGGSWDTSTLLRTVDVVPPVCNFTVARMLPGPAGLSVMNRRRKFASAGDKPRAPVSGVGERPPVSARSGSEALAGPRIAIESGLFENVGLG